MSRLIRPQDARMKSPFTYSDDDIFPVDYAKLQRKVVLRAPKIRPESPGGLLWAFAIDGALWVLIAGAIYWLKLLGFWGWIRGWF